MSEIETAPSPYAPILFQSRLAPHATAVVMESGEISYRTFCADIEKVTRRLDEHALPADVVVSVDVRNQYLRWLAIIGLARLGIVSVSPTESAKGLPVASFSLCDHPGDSAGTNGPEIEIGTGWLRSQTDTRPLWRERRHDLRAPCRLVLSSGTTGVPKKALLTYGQIWARVRGNLGNYGLNPSTRFATLMGTGTIGGFMMPISCWATGGAVLLLPPQGPQPGRDFLGLHPNVLMMSPQQLAGVVGNLPRDHWPREHVAIYVAGSSLPPALSQATRLRLSERLFVVYGSTEAGSVTMAHASAVDDQPGTTGVVLPTAQVQIVDESGRPVATGEAGEVRIRAEGMVDGYVEESDMGSSPFRDGWFYPGDLGALSGDGTLTIAGRVREVMNFGGTKFAPERIEQALASTPGIVEMAAFAIRGPGGYAQPCLAVVRGAGFDEKVLRQNFSTAFRRLPPLTVLQIDALPRNEMGKILRTELADKALRALQQHRAATGAPVDLQ